mgnify:CR=1 FL=1
MKENTELAPPLTNISSPENFISKIWVKTGLLIGLILSLIIIIAYFSMFETSNNENSKFANKVPEISPKLTTSIFKNSAVKKEAIGFLPSWSVANKSKVYPEKLSQIIYFGLSINSDGSIIKYNEDKLPVLEWTYFNSDYFKEIRSEASRSGTKILLSIKSFDNETIDNVISNKTATNRLADELGILITQYDLDGINIDFEYFTDTTFPTSKYLASFLRTLSDKLKLVSPDNIISIDVNATVVIKDKAYNMTEIAKSVDQIILMAYDYKQQNSSRAGPAAPLLGELNEHSISESVESLSGRVPNHKLILGLPFYGFEWRTYTKTQKSTVVPGSGALATYKRVRKLLEENDSINKSWNELSGSPWITYTQYGAIKQIYFEDIRSITEKIKFARSKKMGGIAIWALGYDGGDTDLWNSIEKENIE